MFEKNFDKVQSQTFLCPIFFAGPEPPASASQKRLLFTSFYLTFERVLCGRGGGRKLAKSWSGGVVGAGAVYKRRYSKKIQQSVHYNLNSTYRDKDCCVLSRALGNFNSGHS